jgi:hypothetical protein
MIRIRPQGELPIGLLPTSRGFFFRRRFRIRDTYRILLKIGLVLPQIRFLPSGSEILQAPVVEPDDPELPDIPAGFEVQGVLSDEPVKGRISPKSFRRNNPPV